MSIYNNLSDFKNININKMKKINTYTTFGDIFTYNNYIVKKYKDIEINCDTLREIYAYFYMNKIINTPTPDFYGVFFNREESGIIIEKFKYNLYTIDRDILKNYYISICKQILFYLCLWALFGFSHRDIKPDNIIFDIIDNIPVVKIIDWGSSRFKRFFIKDLSISNTVCTLYTRSPEIIHDKIINKNEDGKYDPIIHDIWSCAATMFFIWDHNEYLFNENTEKEQLNKIYTCISNNKYSEISNIKLPDDDLCDLLDKMLVINVDKRITIDEIIQHPFMDDYRDLLLDTIRDNTQRKVILNDGHLSELRKINIEWLISISKRSLDNEFQLPILLSIMIIDEFITSYNKNLINKTLYLAAYLISAELLKTKSVDLNVYSKLSKIPNEDIIKKQLLIIKKIPYLYELISDSIIIKTLDKINDIDIIKIALILLIYYPNIYYNYDIKINKIIIDIYFGKQSFNNYKFLFNPDFKIVD